MLDALGNSYYIGYYGVIPGKDQESSQWVFTVLSLALCRH